MTKTQREEWDSLVESCRQSAKKLWDSNQEDAILAADLDLRKLERELQALKNKKSMAALLMKAVK